jgi:hypothetical protein
MTEVAILAVINNPELKAQRRQAAVALLFTPIVVGVGGVIFAE